MMDSFFADVSVPARRRLYIYRDPPATDNVSVRGWCFVVDEMNANLEWIPLRDAWEETFSEIMLYPDLYSNEPIIWRESETGQLVSMADISLRYI